MKALQIILISLTALTGCSKKAGPAHVSKIDTTVNTKPMTDSVTYLALGDSYTIGQSVPVAESYPYQLTVSLNSNAFKVKTPTIIATTGWTTDNLIDAIAGSDITNKKFNFVTLLIGVNDQYQDLSLDNYKIKFAQVLNTAITFANGNINSVFVLSIPDWGVTPFAGGRDSEIYPQIMAFNNAAQSICEKAGVSFSNITDISRIAATDPSLLASDGLHPSGKMYALWVNVLEPKVAARLK
ncbi:MAG TPA: SGNH/GDSL hydrolase family protein [Mucilaginibacter sp.]|nr:SGNH/GDSL hydrolase family protein [Mucilaginibacter sp.]